MPPTLAHGKICYVEILRLISTAQWRFTERFSAGACGSAVTEVSPSMMASEK
jgi:hypothetical protein